MKLRFLLPVLLLLCASVNAQTSPGSVYPTSLDSHANLGETANNVFTTLASSMTSSQTTVTLVNGTRFTNSGFGSVGQEIFTWSGKSGNTLTGVVRGADGTTASSHVAGNPVEMRIVSSIFDIHAAAIRAEQIKVGYGASVPINVGDVLTVTAPGQTAWAPPAGGGAVNSVFGRTGSVVAASNDYTFSQIGSKPTTLAGYGITDSVVNTRTVNGHALSADVTVSKSDVGLGNVPNLDATAPANITQDATHRFATDAEKSAWNGKQDALGFTAENTANRRTTFQVTPDDAHYPSEKLVKDSLDAKLVAASNLSDVTNAGTARGNLGLGSMATQAASAVSITGGTAAGLTGLGIRSTGAAFDLTLASSEVLTAGRTLSFVLGDTARSLTIGASASVSGSNTGDQDLSALAPKANPTFTGTVTIPTPFTLGAVSVTATGTELNRVVGVTSGIQAQLDGKQASLGFTAVPNTRTVNGHALSGDVTVTPTDINLVIGTNVQAFSARLSEVATIGTSLQQIRVNAGATALEYFTPSASGSGANPTASVGITAVNGSASTFLRSDGAPALDQSIAPTWTGAHIFSLSNAAALAIGPNGNTNPVVRVITNTASQADGISINGKAAGSGTEIKAISSGSNAGITLTPIGNKDVTVTGGILAAEFSNAGTMTYSFTSSPNSGLWWQNAGGTAGTLFLRNNGTDRLQITGGIVATSSNTNFGIGTTSFGTNGLGVLAIKNATIPTTSPADSIQLYAEDVSSSSELKVRDEAGNVTTLSPHNFSLIGKPSEPMAWAFHSERDGKVINVDMLRVVRLLERLTGEKLVYIAPKPTERKQ